MNVHRFVLTSLRTAAGLATVGLAALVPLGAAATAPPVPSPADPVPLTSPATTLDLPAIVVQPTDLPNLGFGAMDGDVYSGIGSSIWEYTGEIGTPNPATGGESLSRKVITTVRLHADDASAQARLEEDRAMLAGSELTAPRQLVEAPVHGDDSFTSTYVSDTVDGASTANNLEITMRAGVMVLSVSISDFVGTPPTVDELAPLAELVVGRAREVAANGTAGLSHQMLRISDTEPWTGGDSGEGFQVRGSTYLPSVGETPEAIAATTAFFTGGRVVDSYTFQLPLEHDATGAVIEFNSWIYSFATDADAAAYLEYAVNDVVSNPGSRVNVARVEVPGAVAPAVGASMGYPGADGQVYDGHRVWIQVGARVVSVLVDRIGGVPVETVRDLANAQAACVQAPANLCAELPVPAALAA